MVDLVTLTRWSGDNRIALVGIENPPVNAMSIGVPGGILSALTQVNEADDAIATLIVPGGSGILGGADIKTQGKPWPEEEPNLWELIRDLDTFTKPVGILLRRNALGGGLEISMGCHYRIATEGTKLGQPEVKLGIPPGGGGTQRLPRLVGADRALDMILGGDPIDAAAGLEAGLVDLVVGADGAVDAAAAFMVERAAAGGKPPRARDQAVAVSDPGIFAAAREKAAKRMKGLTAPLVCIDCVEAAANTPFDEGLAFERKLFLECVASDEAAALRHVFFAERQAKKVPGIDKSVEARPLATAAVLGAGTMGGGIALCFANAGIPVTVIERDEAALERGMKRIADTIDGQATKGRITAVEAEHRKSLLSSGIGLEAAAAADIVVEAVFEDMDVKKSIFADLAKITKPGSVLATNTSYLDVNEIAAAAEGRESDVLGMHFFSPANIMRLLEVVRAEKTADDVLTTGLALGARLGKTAVVAGVGHGFIGNRMFQQYNREAEFLLQEGASCAQVDGALTGFGMAMGSFAVRDLAGLDIGWANRKATAHLRPEGARYSTVGDVICEKGWFGQKTGKGFYVYEGRKPSPNPDLEAIIAETAREAGIIPGSVTDKMIAQRCFYALVNEGAKILEEGIALRAGDIDLTFINGYGFPRWRGGPMHWADRIGLPQVLAAIRWFDTKHDFWTPAPLLEKLARANKTFADWDRENA